jgi:phenylalanyl-tRNA synthetase beta chain
VKISLNWIADYVTLPEGRSVRDIAHDLTMATVEVEGVHDLAKTLEGVVVGVVLRCDGSDAGGYCVECEVGLSKPMAVRSPELLEAGLQVAVAVGSAKHVPGATLSTPSTLGLAELFPTQGPAAPLRLAKQLCRPGDAVSDVVGWSDFILEIDNKSLTNRPDLWGHYGIARELAAIYRLPLRPLPVKEVVLPPATLVGEIDSAACQRFTATMIAIAGDVETPFWVRSRLCRVGHRPRNLFADLTNYVMLTVGQPCHAYDANRLALPLSVRHAVPNEQFLALDGTTCALKESDVVIADRESPVGLAGVIGGMASAISTDTKDVLLEIASFDALTIRRTSASTGIRTEASTRFEKSLATQRIDEARRLFFQVLHDVEPAARIVGFEDRNIADTLTRTIRASAAFLQRRIGKDLPTEDLREPLERLGLAVEVDGDSLTVTVPDWRNTGDISGSHDLVEEIARLHGYENFDFCAPLVRLEQTVRDFSRGTERRLKEYLAFSCGMQEIISYPWTEDRYVVAAGGNDQIESLRLITPPAPDQGTLRTSLVPGLLKSIASNLRWSSEFRIFEVGCVFRARDYRSIDEAREQLPQQPRHLAAALVGGSAEALFREAKGVIESLGHAIHVLPLTAQNGEQASWADADACLTLTTNGTAIGNLGLLSRRGAREVGIKHGYAAVFELEADKLIALPSRDNRFHRLPDLPTIDVDVNLVYCDSVTWQAIARSAAHASPLISDVQFIDEYRGTGIPPSHRSVTLRARLQPTARSLTSDEATVVTAAIKDAAKRNLGALFRE